MGKYEVTQGEWQKITGSNPSYFTNGSRYPVEMVSWNDINTTFLPELNRRSGGKRQKYAGGNDVGRVAWYLKNSGGDTHPVGTRAANGLGLYDMSGNVWEWCSDWYDENYYSSSPRNNPQGGGAGSDRVVRGGGWFNLPWNVRLAYRSKNAPDFSNNLGFRLVLPVH